MKILWNLEQGSAEWKEKRKGKPTASGFSNIITAAKGELSKSADGYINQLIGETFCPDWEDWQGNKFTERGKEFEAEAREAFQAELIAGDLVEVGFCIADDGVCGCSPDGLILDINKEPVSGVEIKCPSPKTHVGYVRGGVLPDDYKQQVHGSMAVTGLCEWHFWSYFPGMKPLHVIVERDEYTAKLEAALAQFVEMYREARELALPKLQIKL